MLNKLKRLDRNKIFTVALTFFIAWATGYAMQNSDRIAEIFGMDSPVPIENLRLASAETQDPDELSARLPGPPYFALPAPRLAMPPGGGKGAAHEIPDDAGLADMLKPRSFSPFGIACGPVVRAEPLAGARVRIIVNAPCRGEESLAIVHGPFGVPARISKAGLASVVIPALAERAGFEIRIGSGDEKYKLSTEVPDFADFERVALFWEGNAALRIHAIEKISGGMEFPAGASGGEMIRIDGPAAKKAEIYSFPAKEVSGSGVVRLIVAADVNAQTCGREIEAVTMQKNADGAIDPVAVVLQMPGCDRIGQTLMLKNILKDLKIASN